MASKTAATRTDFHIIPARVMTVTRLTQDVTDPDGSRHKVTIAWKVRCLTCRYENILMAHQHRNAVAMTRSHVCGKHHRKD